MAVVHRTAVTRGSMLTATAANGRHEVTMRLYGTRTGCTMTAGACLQSLERKTTASREVEHDSGSERWSGQSASHFDQSLLPFEL
jgi:hypothetical protein